MSMSEIRLVEKEELGWRPPDRTCCGAVQRSVVGQRRRVATNAETAARRMPAALEVWLTSRYVMGGCSAVLLAFALAVCGGEGPSEADDGRISPAELERINAKLADEGVRLLTTS